MEQDLDLSLSPVRVGVGGTDPILPRENTPGTENTSSHCPEPGVGIHGGSQDVKQDRWKKERQPRAGSAELLPGRWSWGGTEGT